jgi:hypothetical protein
MSCDQLYTKAELSNWIAMRKKYDWKAALRRFISKNYSADRALALTRQLDEFIRPPETDFLIGSVSELLDAYENQRELDLNPKSTKSRPLIDDADFKEEIPDMAHRYLELPGVQAPGVTNYLCCALLDTELYPLAREMKDPTDAISSAGGPQVARVMFSHSLFGRIFAWFINFIFLALAALAALAGFPWVAIGLVVLVVWSVVGGIWQGRRVKKAVFGVGQKLRLAHGKLSIIRDEIGSGNYNSDVVKERLRSLEAEGTYVPSILYSLLDLPARR